MKIVFLTLITFLIFLLLGIITLHTIQRFWHRSRSLRRGSTANDDGIEISVVSSERCFWKTKSRVQPNITKSDDNSGGGGDVSSDPLADDDGDEEVNRYLKIYESRVLYSIEEDDKEGRTMDSSRRTLMSEDNERVLKNSCRIVDDVPEDEDLIFSSARSTFNSTPDG